MFRQTTTSAKPSLADPAGGQIVIVIARWLLIVSGLAITLWRSPQSDLNAIRIGLFVLLALAVANFYLHMQILMKRPVIESLLYAASAADILVITLLTWTYGGLDARTFVFYYPALIALALVFPFWESMGFAGFLLALYAIVSLSVASTDFELQVFVERAISLVAVAVVSNLYLRIENDRLLSLEEQARA